MIQNTNERWYFITSLRIIACRPPQQRIHRVLGDLIYCWCSHRNNVDPPGNEYRTWHADSLLQSACQSFRFKVWPNKLIHRRPDARLPRLAVIVCPAPVILDVRRTHNHRIIGQSMVIHIINVISAITSFCSMLYVNVCYIPNFEKLFASLGGELPVLTVLGLSISQFIIANLLMVFI